mmetsp:Transcript_32693/g.107755  ORF Transcript_32693/g.107755 Transcript_32693/m.107755 type:complete len:228 (-) Transcript_32693:661-1344(-)
MIALRLSLATLGPLLRRSHSKPTTRVRHLGHGSSHQVVECKNNTSSAYASDKASAQPSCWALPKNASNRSRTSWREPAESSAFAFGTPCNSTSCSTDWACSVSTLDEARALRTISDKMIRKSSSKCCVSARKSTTGLPCLSAKQGACGATCSNKPCQPEQRPMQNARLAKTDGSRQNSIHDGHARVPARKTGEALSKEPWSVRYVALRNEYAEAALIHTFRARANTK